jgi:hypothetical protein
MEQLNTRQLSLLAEQGIKRFVHCSRKRLERNCVVLAVQLY